MKTKATLLLVLIFGFNFGFSQTDCATKLSLMVEAAKAKSYDTAYPYLMELRKIAQLLIERHMFMGKES